MDFEHGVCGFPDFLDKANWKKEKLAGKKHDGESNGFLHLFPQFNPQKDSAGFCQNEYDLNGKSQEMMDSLPFLMIRPEETIGVGTPGYAKLFRSICNQWMNNGCNQP
jgi:hypothetical protein